MNDRPRMSMRAFVALAREAMGQLPAPFHAWLENVVVDVELSPSPALCEEMELESPDDLFGLFQGHAVTEQEYGDHLPNRILLFKRPIERACRSRAEVVYEIRRTVIHELAHHFGYSEADLDEFESQPSPFDEPGSSKEEN
ncbi:MAG: metallopeptidase family protein [Planctomycetes bacterium]|nr:metallopeptidase family protein [Planctomycetota bacterium]